MSVSVSKTRDTKERHRHYKDVEVHKNEKQSHHHHHHHHHELHRQEDIPKTENTYVKEKNTKDLDENTWRETFKLVTRLLAKTAGEDFKEPETDEEMRALLVEMTGAVCKKARQPKESREYMELEEKYERSQQKTKNMQKRAEKLLVEVEENKKNLDDHLRKVKLGEKTETDKILKGIDALMIEQAEIHKEFLRSETISPVRSSYVPVSPIHRHRHHSKRVVEPTISSDYSDSYSN